MALVRQYLEQKLSALMEEQESDVATAAASASMVGNNADRFTLTFTNTGANDVWLSLSQKAAVGTGILLAANGGQVSMTAEFDLGLPTRQWFAQSPNGASSLHIIEEIGFTSPLQSARGQ